MPSCKLTFIANAGVVMELDGFRVWVDALNAPAPGFSHVTDGMWARMKQEASLRPPDALFFTHSHPDHFSQKLAQEALARWPEAKLIMPENPFAGQIDLTGEQTRLTVKGADMRFHYLPHLGGHSNRIPHYGCVVERGGARVLFTGDSVGAGHALKALLDDRPVDVAVMAFPWIVTQGGRNTIERFIRPAHVAVVHIPFSADDTDGLRESAVSAGPLLKTDTRLLLEPFQTEAFGVAGQ